MVDDEGIKLTSWSNLFVWLRALFDNAFEYLHNSLLPHKDIGTAKVMPTREISGPSPRT